MDEYGAMFRLDGRTALVVGAGSGIGAAAAAGLAAFGAAVVCADADADRRGGDGDRARRSGHEHPARPLDAAVIVAAADDLGAPDVLVTTPSVNVRKPIVDYADDELDRVVDLNIKGTFRLCRAFGRLMAAPGGAR